MRSIAVRADAAGVQRLFLNGKPLFQLGLLDQGWWPDGLYTAPTDEALAFDIQKTKELGFNMIRKHVKVEPARWYYHADRLGMLVWQDMPSGNNKGADGRSELRARAEGASIDALRNHPSIVMWVPFNEGWGQHETEQIRRVAEGLRSDAARQQHQRLDRHEGRRRRRSARLSRARRCRRSRPARAAVLGEFGGLGLPLEGHTWLDRGNWGYRSFTSLAELNTAYRICSRSCGCTPATACRRRSTRRRPTSKSRSTA